LKSSLFGLGKLPNKTFDARVIENVNEKTEPFEDV
jgi:hypothetical protein